MSFTSEVICSDPSFSHQIYPTYWGDRNLEIATSFLYNLFKKYKVALFPVQTPVILIKPFFAIFRYFLLAVLICKLD